MRTSATITKTIKHNGVRNPSFVQQIALRLQSLADPLLKIYILLGDNSRSGEIKFMGIFEE